MKWYLINYVILFLLAAPLCLIAKWTLFDWQLWACMFLAVAMNISGFIEGKHRER